MAARASESKEEEEEFVIRRSQKAEETPYWQPNVAKVLQPSTREFFQRYAQIPPAEIEPHIREIQKRAWEVAPFPSVGAMTWLNPFCSLLPQYEPILNRVRAGASILDCACMVAPDLRKLAYDGAPTGEMYGFDVESEFFDIGFDLYKDRATWRGKFFPADALRPFQETELGTLVGKLDIVWCAKFIHIFDREGQIEMMVKLVSLLKPEKGSLFVGSQNGFPGGMTVPVADDQKFVGMSGEIFLGDTGDMEEMWAEVARRTGTQWELEATFLDMRTIGLHEDDGSPYKKRTGYNLQWVATMK
ncbi:Hypothetical predicted protein [Lecanosticta acicola]|uniref:Methyltransferase domain-containing protein n=1 Tax=Lecanosticta acicola TaxID=111012 RepID=A0AAI8YVF0_9PEZI|nr:Hypothetical predicted protein [Lecanosticta acicola]